MVQIQERTSKSEQKQSAEGIDKAKRAGERNDPLRDAHIQT